MPFQQVVQPEAQGTGTEPNPLLGNDLHAPISAAQVVQPVQLAFVKLIRKEPALGLSLAYLFLTAVGVTYDFWLYSFFRINIMDYADISDFLLAAIREPIVILFTVLSSGAILLFQEVNYRLRLLFSWYDAYCRLPRIRPTKPGEVRVWIFISIIIYFGCFFTPYYASYQAVRIKSGQGRSVEVSLVMDPNRKILADSKQYAMIGATSRFLIVYDPQTKRPTIIPHSNIARITVLSSLPGAYKIIESKAK